MSNKSAITSLSKKNDFVVKSLAGDTFQNSIFSPTASLKKCTTTNSNPSSENATSVTLTPGTSSSSQSSSFSTMANTKAPSVTTSSCSPLSSSYSAKSSSTNLVMSSSSCSSSSDTPLENGKPSTDLAYYNISAMTNGTTLSAPLVLTSLDSSSNSISNNINNTNNTINANSIFFNNINNITTTTTSTTGNNNNNYATIFNTDNNNNNNNTDIFNSNDNKATGEPSPSYCDPTSLSFSSLSSRNSVNKITGTIASLSPSTVVVKSLVGKVAATDALTTASANNTATNFNKNAIYNTTKSTSSAFLTSFVSDDDNPANEINVNNKNNEPYGTLRATTHPTSTNEAYRLDSSEKKTIVCTPFFKEGYCGDGSRCLYAHNVSELEPGVRKRLANAAGGEDMLPPHFIKSNSNAFINGTGNSLTSSAADGGVGNNNLGEIKRGNKGGFINQGVNNNIAVSNRSGNNNNYYGSFGNPYPMKNTFVNNNNNNNGNANSKFNNKRYNIGRSNINRSQNGSLNCSRSGSCSDDNSLSFVNVNGSSSSSSSNNNILNAKEMVVKKRVGNVTYHQINNSSINVDNNAINSSINDFSAVNGSASNASNSIPGNNVVNNRGNNANANNNLVNTSVYSVVSPARSINTSLISSGVNNINSSIGDSGGNNNLIYNNNIYNNNEEINNNIGGFFNGMLNISNGHCNTSNISNKSLCNNNSNINTDASFSTFSNVSSDASFTSGFVSLNNSNTINSVNNHCLNNNIINNNINNNTVNSTSNISGLVNNTNSKSCSGSTGGSIKTISSGIINTSGIISTTGANNNTSNVSLPNAKKVLPTRCHYPHSMISGTYYDHLNVKPNCSSADVNKAYAHWRKSGYGTAKKIDPMKADMMDKLVVDAKLVLGSPLLRAEYDRLLPPELFCNIISNIPNNNGDNVNGSSSSSISITNEYNGSGILGENAFLSGGIVNTTNDNNNANVSKSWRLALGSLEANGCGNSIGFINNSDNNNNTNNNLNNSVISDNGGFLFSSSSVNNNGNINNNNNTNNINSYSLNMGLSNNTPAMPSITCPDSGIFNNNCVNFCNQLMYSGGEGKNNNNHGTGHFQGIDKGGDGICTLSANSVVNYNNNNNYFNNNNNNSVSNVNLNNIRSNSSSVASASSHSSTLHSFVGNISNGSNFNNLSSNNDNIISNLNDPSMHDSSFRNSALNKFSTFPVDNSFNNNGINLNNVVNDGSCFVSNNNYNNINPKGNGRGGVTVLNSNSQQNRSSNNNDSSFSSALQVVILPSENNSIWSSC